MVALNTIRKIQIQATQSGVPEVTTALTGLSAAQERARQTSDGLTVATVAQERASLSVATALNRQRMADDVNYRMQVQQERALKTYNNALNQGLITTSQYAEAQVRVQQRYKVTEAANDNLSKKTGLAAHEMKNLGFQVNDVATMLASGSSPFQVLATQGGQFYQILAGSEKGLVGSLKGFGAATLGLLGPLGMFGVALAAATTAAYGLHSLIKTEGPTVEKLLDEHARLVGVVKSAYDNATKSARDWFNQSKEVSQLQLLQQQLDLRRKLNEETGKVLTPTLDKSFVAFFTGGSMGDASIQAKFKPFSDAIYTLNEQLQAGSPNVRQFVDEVARIGLANPALQKVAAELIKTADTASTLGLKLRDTDLMLKLLAGGSLTETEKKTLGLATSTTAAVSSYDNLIQRTRDRITELNFEAETADRTSGAVLKLKLMHDLERAAKQSNVSVTGALRAEWDKLAESMAAADRASKLSRINQNTDFERRTMFLPDGERQIASSLREVYGNDVTGALESAAASPVRFNQELAA